MGVSASDVPMGGEGEKTALFAQHLDEDLGQFLVGKIGGVRRLVDSRRRGASVRVGGRKERAGDHAEEVDVLAEDRIGGDEGKVEADDPLAAGEGGASVVRQAEEVARDRAEGRGNERQRGAKNHNARNGNTHAKGN